MRDTLISIVIPAHNAEKLIRNSPQSLDELTTGHSPLILILALIQVIQRAKLFVCPCGITNVKTSQIPLCHSQC